MKTFWNFSEEPEPEVEPESCEDHIPCVFPGCQDLSCEDFCEKDMHCGKTFFALTKKCCECNICEDNDSEEKTTGKFIHFSIPFSDFEIHQKRKGSFKIIPWNFKPHFEI